MNPVNPFDYMPFMPEGAILVELGSPDGLEDVVSPMIYVKIGDNYFGFWEFENEEERQAFFQSERFVIKTLGTPCPISVGAVDLAGAKENQESSEPGLFPERN